MKNAGLYMEIEMSYEDALKLVKKFGGYMYRKNLPNYLLHFDIQSHKLCLNYGEFKVNPVLLSDDLSANDWVADLNGCWKDQ